MTSSLPNSAWCIARRPSDASCRAGKGKKKPLPNRSWSMQGIARPSDVISCRAGKGKKKPQYGSGRDALGSSSPVESLHFGRLIGESAKDTAQKLDQQSQKSPKEDDARAKLYLEKWTQEEDASYEMFESLLQGKPLDERAKKIKDIEFAEIMRMSADDEMLDDFEAVALSSSDEGVEGAVEAACLSKQSKDQVGPPPSYDAFAALLDPQTAAGSSGAAVSPPASPAVSPPASPAASPAGPALEQTGGGQRETAAERKATKRQRNMARAKALLSKDAFVEAKIWKANRAGLLVDADHVTGFLPFRELSPDLKHKVREAQDKAAVHFQENGERAREAGMSVLMGATLSVRVISVDDQTERVVLSMLQPSEAGGGSSGSSGGSRSGLGGGSSSPGPSHAVSQEVLQQASAKVGSILPCTVTNVTDFGVFCRFDVNGTEMVGLVYRTEISWLEDGDVAMNDISVGATRPAKVVHVDMNKAHVFLSFKRTTPNPLLETLDTLMMSGGDRSASSTGTGRETVESIDLRPLLGDMDDAVAIANSLRQVGFHRVALGPRLNSKATSQAVELYLAKAKPGEGEQTTMIVRRGDAVQEIIVGSSDRERIKNVVGSLQLDNQSI